MSCGPQSTCYIWNQALLVVGQENLRTILKELCICPVAKRGHTKHLSSQWLKQNALAVTLKDGRVPSHYSENWQKGKTEHSSTFSKNTNAWQGKEFQLRNRKNRTKNDDFVTPNEILNLRGSVMDAHSIWGPGMRIWSGRSSWWSRPPAQP